MTKCIDPTAIKEGDLMAYLDGEADERVQAHVERCPACAVEVERLRKACQGLLGTLYRTDCPAPEVLGQYKMKLLAPAQQLEIAAHVRDCPHCTRELEELAHAEEKEDRLVQVLLHVLQDVAQTVETTMIPRGRPHPVGVRGAENDSAPLHFHSDEVDVLIGFQPTTPPTEMRTLLGAVVQAEAVSGSRAWLFQEGESPVSSPVDRLGTFTFASLSPGEYDVALEVGRKALLMRNVMIS